MLYYPQLVSLSKIKLTNEDDRPTYSIVFASSTSCFQQVSRIVCVTTIPTFFTDFEKCFLNPALAASSSSCFQQVSRIVCVMTILTFFTDFEKCFLNPALAASSSSCFQLSRLDTQLKSRNQNQIADLIPAFIILEFPRIAPYYFFILFLSSWLIILSSY